MASSRLRPDWSKRCSEEAVEASGGPTVVLGLAGGALTFFVGRLRPRPPRRPARTRPGGSRPSPIRTPSGWARCSTAFRRADTAMREGFQHGGSTVGLVTHSGFVTAFLLSHPGEPSKGTS